ncbi:MAG: anti-sigma factor antagonist [Rariglobus sp.]|jgi:anti-anti-sigma factor|nr:anti-sigma factor antagonist [Rariglobus sp.]
MLVLTHTGCLVMIECISDSGPVVLSLKGRLDSTTSELLETQLRTLYAEGHRCFILACAELNYLNSAGLRVLMAVRKTLAQHTPSGGIHLAEARSHVRDVVQLSGLDGLFPLHASLAEARAAAGGTI